MAIESMKYCEYFDIDEKYFPCIDESAINSGAAWDTTFPHETFINLLNTTEKMLGGITNRSIWIHGAYGTGMRDCSLLYSAPNKRAAHAGHSRRLVNWQKRRC